MAPAICADRIMRASEWGMIRALRPAVLLAALPLVTLSLGSLGSLAHAAPAGRYYVVIRGVDEASGVKSGVVNELRALFVDELKRHAEFTLDPPPGLPQDPEQMSEELKKRKLRAFELTLKVLGVTRATNPPPAGKQYRVLVRGIKLSIVGDTLPEKVMAIGGDGAAEVGAEIGAHENEEKTGNQLLLDASKEAIRQAVEMTVTKLNLAAKPEKKLKKKP
jgi:hypothetical protein